MKETLIIGSRGMLGGELVRVFGADKNYQIFGWDREEIDITNRDEMREKILTLAPQIIINATGYNAVDKAEEPSEFEQAKLLNGYAVGWLAEAAKELGAVFVNYNSDYVFDGSRQEGYRENNDVSPISNYGISKVLGESEARRVGGQYYIIRLQKLFGKTGDSPAAKKSFFETMLKLAETKKELDIVDDELSNFTYAPDLAERTKLLVENSLTSPRLAKLGSGNKSLLSEPVEGYPYGVYHITNEGRPVTWFGAAQILFDLAGVKNIKLNPVGSEKFPRAAQRPKYSILLNTKLPALRPWHTALKDFLDL